MIEPIQQGPDWVWIQQTVEEVGVDVLGFEPAPVLPSEFRQAGHEGCASVRIGRDAETESALDVGEHCPDGPVLPVGMADPLAAMLQCA